MLKTCLSSQTRSGCSYIIQSRSWSCKLDSFGISLGIETQKLGPRKPRGVDLKSSRLYNLLDMPINRAWTHVLRRLGSKGLPFYGKKLEPSRHLGVPILIECRHLPSRDGRWMGCVNTSNDSQSTRHTHMLQIAWKRAQVVIISNIFSFSDLKDSSPIILQVWCTDVKNSSKKF